MRPRSRWCHCEARDHNTDTSLEVVARDSHGYGGYVRLYGLGEVELGVRELLWLLLRVPWALVLCAAADALIRAENATSGTRSWRA